jgi:hypothetical protein
MERADTGLLWNLKKMSSIGRIPSTNNENEIQTELVCLFYEFVDRILSLLNIKSSHTLETAE